MLYLSLYFIFSFFLPFPTFSLGALTTVLFFKKCKVEFYKSTRQTIARNMNPSTSSDAVPTERWEVPRIKWQQLGCSAVLGRGHHAIVYSASLTLPDGQRRPVALKKLIPKPLAMKNIPLEEARVLQALVGVEGVPRLYGMTDSPPHVLVMSKCPGLTLSVLRQRGEVRTCLTAVQKLCTILSKMHARGVTHGDLHGCNILVSLLGGNSNACVWLIDFGNAQRNAEITVMKTDEKQLLKLLINILMTMKEASDKSIFHRRQEVIKVMDANLNLVEISSLVCNILHG